jgi:predicted ferric reductase
MVVLEVIVHVCAWTVTEVASANWAGLVSKIQTNLFLQCGFASAIAMILLLLTSPSLIRHAFYETFLNAHIAFVAISFTGIWMHCDIALLPQLPYIQLIVGLWASDRLFRFARLLWWNVPRKGRQWTRATLEPLLGETTRVTMQLPTRLDIGPGCHGYLRFSFSPWESHPFSIAWNEQISPIMTLPSHSSQSSNSSRPPLSSTSSFSSFSPCLKIHEKNNIPATTTQLSFIIRAQTGMTRRLYEKARAYPGMTIRAAFEGPYGACHSLDSYGHAVLFAGSSGITFQLAYLRHLAAAAVARTVATRRVTLIWIIREREWLEWIQPWVQEILSGHNAEIVTIKIYVTKAKTSEREKLEQLKDARITLYPGRPDIKGLIEEELRCQVGAMAVTVCGPGALADDVRREVRDVQEASVVDFLEESFTW